MELHELEKEYLSLTLPGKFEFFWSFPLVMVESSSPRDISNFLAGIALDEAENSGIRKLATETHTELAVLKKINLRHALRLLIDDWQQDSSDIFLETRRLKDLFLFYEEEPQEIKNIYNQASESSELEIQSESFYQLGVIYLLEALDRDASDNVVRLLEQSTENFFRSVESSENRIDAIFFSDLVSLITDLLQGRDQSIHFYLSRLAQNLWKNEVFSLQNKANPYRVSFYRSLYALGSIRTSINAKSKWLDYREEFNKVAYYFNIFKNEELKERLSRKLLKDKFSNYLNEQMLEPYFALNLAAELSKIEHRLQELESSSDEYELLNYLKQCIQDKSQKKKTEDNSLQIRLERMYPQLRPETIAEKLESYEGNLDLHKALNLVDELSLPTEEIFLDTLISICIELQGDKKNWEAKEDDRNRFIQQLLEQRNYIVKDQTRWSRSHAGKSDGEVDLFVHIKNGAPFSIIEGLNLDSMKKAYVSLHLIKILNYDTIGLPFNYIIVYSRATSFSSLWGKYKAYIPSVDYPHKFLEFNEIEEFRHADIRVGKSKHLRHSKTTYLYHVMINLLQG